MALFDMLRDLVLAGLLLRLLHGLLVEGLLFLGRALALETCRGDRRFCLFFVLAAVVALAALLVAGLELLALLALVFFVRLLFLVLVAAAVLRLPPELPGRGRRALGY